MPFESFAAFYRSEAQSVFLLHALPLAFLGWRAAVATPHERAVAPAASRFVAGWTLLFAFLTLVDPWATGPLVKGLGLADGVGGSAVMFLFVWLGDFRVLGLIFVVAASTHSTAPPRSTALARAAALTCVVPVASFVSNAALTALVAGLPAQTLWVIYELGFLALAVWIGRRWIDRHVDDDDVAAYLRALAGFSAAYYALWASADLVILALGADAGWALRVVPNQLYYGGWVVFAYARFYSGAGSGPTGSRRTGSPGAALAAPKTEARSASSTSTHASR